MRPEARGASRPLRIAPARAVLVSLALAPAVVTALATGGALLVTARPLQAADLTPQQQVESGLLCYCGCAGLTVRTCTCGTADSVRREIAERLGSGETPQQVIEAFIARHGEQMRPAPPKSGFNLVGWVTPFALLLLAGGSLVALVRHWQTRGLLPVAVGATGRGPAAPDAPLTDKERDILKRVERELKERV
ncbi:MAG TPA: cytochrome c-type biogenesis protein CcmH [Candidatus Polarisedimenticolia bacterium]|nr:cytochrome c-type biogenesis protein CcmH [Candidatus Polarisedimenticolia bacterium]